MPLDLVHGGRIWSMAAGSGARQPHMARSQRRREQDATYEVGRDLCASATTGLQAELAQGGGGGSRARREEGVQRRAATEGWCGTAGIGTVLGAVAQGTGWA